MKNNKFILVSFVVLSLFLAGCSSSAPVEKPASTPAKTSDVNVNELSGNDPMYDKILNSTEKFVDRDGYNYSPAFVKRIDKKSRLLTDADGFTAELNNFGKKPGKFNFSLLKPLNWSPTVFDNVMYRVEAADGNSGFGLVYYDKNAGAFSEYTTCEALVKKLFTVEDNQLTINNVKDVTVDGKKMERVYYEDWSKDGNVQYGRLIDQCYKTNDYLLLMDVTLPSEDKIVSENVGGVEVRVDYNEADRILQDFLFEEI